MSVIKSAVKNPVTTALIFVAFVILGLYSLVNTSIALFPEFDSNTIMVMSSYPGANASDIETNLTKLLENTLNSVEDLKKLSSQSKENVSILTLEFEYGTDIEEARQHPGHLQVQRGRHAHHDVHRLRHRIRFRPRQDT